MKGILSYDEEVYFEQLIDLLYMRDRERERERERERGVDFLLFCWSFFDSSSKTKIKH
jgi:hypothetical protein